MEKKLKKIALLGNPNSGKSSLFNQLTGLNQKVGNFPGVTVDKKTGTCQLTDDSKVKIFDLPGVYSIYPRSIDENIVFDVLNDPTRKDYPDLALVVVDGSNLQRSLLLFTQVIDLGVPAILVINMIDLANKTGIVIDEWVLMEKYHVQVLKINARKGEGIDKLKQVLTHNIPASPIQVFEVKENQRAILDQAKNHFNLKNDYGAYQLIHQLNRSTNVNKGDRVWIKNLLDKHQVDYVGSHTHETLHRYQHINKVLKQAVSLKKTKKNSTRTEQLDKIMVHKIWGYLIFLAVLLTLFQAIFVWASWPMDIIDLLFSKASIFIKKTLPTGDFTNMLAEGIIPGIGGVLIFVPQIALLFAFISLLEESGYMSRVVFLMDRLMRPLGLSGKSIVPLISGAACAIPAIMATRSIEDWKSRLITILVTPFISCSARLPVYTILIALVVPAKNLFGLINMQGLALLLMYLLGFFMALVSAVFLKLVLRVEGKSYFIMELPTYKVPQWKNICVAIIEKSKAFVFEAGKIILAISILLWVFATYGPMDQMNAAEEKVLSKYGTLSDAEFEQKVNAYKLEHSYIGICGQAIEPIIKPLGYDWKIGIALITSFAAREVFVGTIATIYSIRAGDQDESTIKERMRNELRPNKKPRYDTATAFSLLVFYALAMQCMSTLAIVKRETNSWKWPILQLLYMSGSAYLLSLITYSALK